ncbi:hypothetical protein Pdsh_05895 [Pyrodictium delaneyi]|uniref:Glutamine amidotransferase type-2 domain-containing protein n=2 Tax=Pyrodictium delaneyi TaxID=1273541 RepID=A0A211YNL8_9CREN|nr:hypothetical protein Pdsh_05895 [Pyrodictium delaneyi]
MSMCRLVAGVAWNREGSGTLAELIRLLAKAASNDPYLAAITGGEARHCHGLGFLLVLGIGTSWRVIYERFDALTHDIDEEEACQANLDVLRGIVEHVAGLISTSERAYVIVHARRAGRSEPRGSLNAHPFVVTLEQPEASLELYLAHNGGLHKDVLGERLGVNPSAYTDSHLLAMYLVRRLQMGVSLSDAIAEAREFTKSGLDLAIALLDRGANGVKPTLYLVGYMKPGLDENRQKYYEPIGFLGDGTAGYVSSTIRDLAIDKGLPLKFERIWGVYEAEIEHGLRKLKDL